MTSACEQPAKHFTKTFLVGVSLIDNDGVISGWAGQRAIQPFPLRRLLRASAIASARREPLPIPLWELPNGESIVRPPIEAMAKTPCAGR